MSVLVYIADWPRKNEKLTYKSQTITVLGVYRTRHIKITGLDESVERKYSKYSYNLSIIQFGAFYSVQGTSVYFAHIHRGSRSLFILTLLNGGVQ